MEGIKTYSKFLVISYLIAFILLCLVSVIFTYTNINDSLLLTFVFAIVVISNLVGSTLTSRKIKKRGILTGIVFGVIYFVLIYIFSAIFYTGIFVNNTVLMYLLMTAVSGAIGGIVGVNL